MNMIRTFVIQKVFLLVFTIFIFIAKQRSKWNSRNINYNYLLNKIVGSHTSIRYSHGIYECITIWCVFELVRTSLLIDYLLRDLWDAIFIGYLSFQRYNSVDYFSIAYPVVFNAAAYATWYVSNSRLLLCCTLLALVSSVLELWDLTATKMRIVERGLHFVGCNCGWSRICDVARADVVWCCSFDPETVGS